MEVVIQDEQNQLEFLYNGDCLWNETVWAGLGPNKPHFRIVVEGPQLLSMNISFALLPGRDKELINGTIMCAKETGFHVQLNTVKGTQQLRSNDVPIQLNEENNLES